MKRVDSIIEEVIEDLIKQGYGHCSSIEGHEVVTLLVERVNKVNVEPAQNETNVLPTFTKGASSSKQPSNLLCSFLDDLKVMVVNSGDVGAGLQMVHKDMSSLEKKAKKWKSKYNPNKGNYS
ncbi:hypothetical protein Sjap_022289 [Stephania japonica]|uniref:Uncharacterized protein n=1 Tax=Stephania japonica TaxID=461633 RepID=A0AAP0HTK3_9MAGN